MTARGRARATTVWAGAVAVIGIGVLVWVCAVQLPRIAWGSGDLVAATLLAALLFAGELTRMRVVRGDGDSDRLSVSSTFAVVLCLVGPLCFALIAQVAACALDDALRRKVPPLRIAFNAGQYALTLLAVRAVFALPQDIPLLATGAPPPGAALWPAVAAAVTYFVMNNLVVGVVVALHTGRPLTAVFREDLHVQGLDSAILLALAPITYVVVSERALLLVPLVALPIAGVCRNAWIAARRQYESLHDDLTGLPNRKLFRLRAQRALDEARATGGRAAVLLIDLDHFKEVNDTLGHHVGDGLLRQVAARLSAACPDLTVARLGGDEFAVVVPGVAAGEDVTTVVDALAARAMARLDEPVPTDGMRLGVHASIGFAIYPDHAGTVDTLLQRADLALYRAKDNRGEVQGYRPHLDPHSIRRLSLHGDLHAAVGGPEIAMVYQPLVDARTGEAVGVEALMRWEHPEHGPVSPEVFIPLAESSGLIGPLTRTAVEASLATLAELRRQGHDLTVAINLSARLLSDLGVPRWLAERLRQAGVPADRLTVEVTESSLTADPERAMRVLAELRRLGVRIAIDDFGTGYSSLSYLTRLQPDDIKIDRSFVARMREDEDSAVIVRSTIDLAHGLGLVVTAEGVEDQATYDALAALGCDRMQGFHIARPVPAPALEIWARQAKAPA